MWETECVLALTASGRLIFFADLYSSWQRGSNVNANGLLQEYYPRKLTLLPLMSVFSSISGFSSTLHRNRGSNMFRKVVLIGLVLLLLLLSGCSSQNSQITSPINISVLYNNRASIPFKDDWKILEEYKTRQNVILDVRLGDDAAYDKAISSVFASGNLPDVILKCWPEAIESYAKSGLLLPLSDYESLMPNFIAFIKARNLQSEIDKLRLSDGKYYILPGYQRDIQVQQWIYRRDVFDQNHMKIPETYDQLFDSLVELKKLYPESTPITGGWKGAHLFAMMGAGYGIPAGWAGTCYYSTAKNQWLYSPATDNYKEMYKFLHRCYAAGILDPELFTQSDEEINNKLINGKAFVTVTWITSGFETWNTKLKQNGISNGEWAALPVMESTIGLKALPAVNPFKKGLIVSMHVANEKNFENILRFLDWAVYSQEGMDLTSWGIEGLTYQNTTDGKAYLQNIKTPKNPLGTLDIEKEYGFNVLFNLNENVSFEDYKKPAEIVNFLARSEKDNETLAMNPALKLGTDDMELVRITNEALQPYVDDTSLKFITGELNIDSDWGEYLATLEKKGSKVIETIWNDAWKKQVEVGK